MNLTRELDLAAAPSDTVRAHVIEALAVFAQVAQLPVLQGLTAAAMPDMAGNPHWRAPDAWRERYLAYFAMYSDPDQGVDRDLAPRYCNEYWQSLTDAQRQQRYDNPALGKEDAMLDAKTINEAGIEGAPTVSTAPPAPAALYPSPALLFDGTVASASAITRWANQFPELAEGEPNASYITMDGVDTTDDLLIAVGDENVPVPVGAWVLRANNDFLILVPPAPAAEDLIEKPGDTLADNVRHLLSNCPHTVRDLSGERTGMRGREDLIGSLAITFVGMQGKLARTGGVPGG